MPNTEHMPEGTDQIIEGAGAGDEADEFADGGESFEEDERSDRARPQAQASTRDDASADPKPATAGGDDVPFTPSAMFERFDQIKAQGYDRAREYAQTGLDRTVGAVEDVVRMLNDAAGQIDDKVGAQYGDYARRAADSVGGLSEMLKGKDVDDLFADAREIVKKSPAVAIGAAAALGFVVARLARAGIPDAPTTEHKGGKAA